MTRSVCETWLQLEVPYWQPQQESLQFQSARAMSHGQPAKCAAVVGWSSSRGKRCHWSKDSLEPKIWSSYYIIHGP